MPYCVSKAFPEYDENGEVKSYSAYIYQKETGDLTGFAGHGESPSKAVSSAKSSQSSLKFKIWEALRGKSDD